jgi:PAS domain S-box-containing protein
MQREQFGMHFEDWMECVVPQDRGPAADAVHMAVEKGDYDLEFRIQRRDNGDIRWMHGRGKIYPDEAGNPSRMLGINIDITDQKNAEQALRESEERYRVTLDSITDGICIQAVRDARYLYANPAFMAMTGFNEAEIIGRTPAELNLPVDFTDQDQYMRCVSSSTGSNRLAMRHRRKDGTLLETLVSCNTIQYQGEDCSVVVIADITQFKRSEDEKKRLESQLANAQKMEALGTLAGGVAHDFNNILTAIMGYTELARMNAAVPEKVDRSLENALKACKRARDLVGQILSFSRHAGAGFTRLTLSYTIAESLNMLRSLIPSNIEIRRNLDVNSKVNADPSQINQMIINLSVNAAQAMGVKGGILEITLDRTYLTRADSLALNLPEGPYLRLQVRDTGRGISPEIMDHIFEPYFTTKKEAGSTGLGLSIVHGIVKRHAGAITVRSVPGRGTTFEICLPEASAEEEKVVEEEEAGIPTGTERILFVDDEETLVEVAENLLSSLGYKVSAFTGSLEALDFFRKNAAGIDLVVTDMTMPDLTGDRLATEILKIRPDLPVIMYTGYSEYITKEKAKSLGIRKFILKPFEIEDLARIIRQELDRGKMAGI